jgi:hypothetical protein
MLSIDAVLNTLNVLVEFPLPRRGATGKEWDDWTDRCIRIIRGLRKRGVKATHAHLQRRLTTAAGQVQ